MLTNHSHRALFDSERRRAIARQAHQCARWLRVNGFEIIIIMGGTHLPRILVKPQPLCHTLDGVVQAFERTQKGERHYQFVTRFGCMVAWEGVQ